MPENEDKTVRVPLIVFTDQTPYLVVGLEDLRDSRGGIYSVRPVTALCRCGVSGHKPYCDGTHAERGIPTGKKADRLPDRVKEYRGADITVLDNRGVCSHDASCIKFLPSVFRKNDRPWIAPDAAPVEEVIRVVRMCPSGALSYSLEGTRHQNLDRPPAVIVKRHGPLCVTGGIVLMDDIGSRPESPEHYTLCRCGASRNLPFCDGSHFPAQFRDG